MERVGERLREERVEGRGKAEEMRECREEAALFTMVTIGLFTMVTIGSPIYNILATL